MRLLAICLTTTALALTSCTSDSDTPADPAPTVTVTVTMAPPDAAEDPDLDPDPPEATETPVGPRPWPTTDVEVPFAGDDTATPTLIDVRTGAHPDGRFDRIAFEFDGQLPGYRVGYESEIVYDGSGEPVDLAGDAHIQLVFSPARAHDDDFQPTMPSLGIDPVSVGYDTLTAYVLNGDFEGMVSLALGLAAERGFRIEQFGRDDGTFVVYVDLAHQ